MLTPTFNRCQLRRTACVTLLAWLSGVANACLLPPRGQAASSASAASANSHPEFAAAGLIDSTVAHVGHRHQSRHSAHQGDHGAAKEDAGKADCRKFCDESLALAKRKFAPANPPTPVVVAVVEWPATAPLLMGALRRSASRGPPLVMRFLRLTI